MDKKQCRSAINYDTYLKFSVMEFVVALSNKEERFSIIISDGSIKVGELVLDVLAGVLGPHGDWAGVTGIHGNRTVWRILVTLGQTIILVTWRKRTKCLNI